MNQSLGYTVTLNIMIVFIVIIFFFISGILIYFKGNKVNNVIIDALERHEGFNHLSREEIEYKISSIGYNRNKITCESGDKITSSSLSTCNLISNNGESGYCIYRCDAVINEEKYFYFKVKTNMMFNLPIINDIINSPIYANTTWFYDFES